MWGAWLVDTRTGIVGARLPLLAGTASVTLNDADEWDIQVPDGFLDTAPADAYQPWRASVLIAHSCDLLPSWAPFAFGPITTPPAPDTVTINGSRHAVDKITGAGMRKIFEYRIETGVDYRPGAIPTDASITFEGMSLGTIQSELVRRATQRAGGMLPLTFPAQLRETGLGSKGHTRTYEGWNVANNSVDKLITDLTEVKNGPDFMLRPTLSDPDAGQWKATCKVLHGTSTDPHIPQDRQLVWDATAPHGPMTGFEVPVSASTLCTRVWATGAGEGSTTAMQVAQADDLLAEGMPLLERTEAHQSVESTDVLAQHAAGTLESGRTVTRQVNATIEADHPSSVLGTWHVGDRVTLITPPHRNLPAGEHLMTIIDASIDLGSETVTVHMQEV